MLTNTPPIRIAVSLANEPKVTKFWRSAECSPNSDLEHFEMVCSTRREVETSVYIIAEDEGEVKSLIVARLERVAMGPTIGYLKLPRMKMKVLSIVTSGILGDLDSRTARGMLHSISTFMEENAADVAIFHNVHEKSSIFAAVADFSWRTIGARKPTWRVHRALRLKSEPGFLLANMKSKHRSWIRKKRKELEEEFPNRVRWLWTGGREEVAGLCEKMEMVARTTYQRGLGAGFVNDEAQRERLDLFARRGQLRVLLLEIDGVPKGFWLGSIYRGTFHSDATGYCQDLKSYEVGTLMFLEVVDSLVKEGVQSVDFGLGDAQYKERFGDLAWREATLYMFSATPRAMSIKVYLQLGAALECAARWIARYVGGIGRIRKGWRTRLGTVQRREVQEESR